jgi:hypothetical protein
MGQNFLARTISDEVQLILAVQRADPTIHVDVEMNKRPEP